MHPTPLQQGKPIPEAFHQLLPAMESSTTEFKQPQWYKYRPDQTFNPVTHVSSKFLFRLLMANPGRNAPRVTLAFGVEASGRVAGLPLDVLPQENAPTGEVPDFVTPSDTVVDTVKKALKGVFPNISRQVKITFVPVEPPTATATGDGSTDSHLFTVACDGMSVAPTVPVGASLHTELAQAGLHVSLGLIEEEDGRGEPVYNPVLIFDTEAAAARFAPKATVTRRCPASVRTVPLYVIVVTFAALETDAPPACFDYNWAQQGREVAGIRLPAILNNSIASLTPPAMWALLRSVRDPSGLWRLWHNPRHAVVLLRYSSKTSNACWVFVDGHGTPLDKARDLLPAYLYGRTLIFFVVLTNDAAMDGLDPNFVRLINKAHATVNAGSLKWTSLELALVSLSPTCVGPALGAVARLRKDGSNVSLRGAWLCPMRSHSRLGASFPATRRWSILFFRSTTRLS